MPQLDLKEAQELVGRVVENPGGPASQQIPDRTLIEALATILVRGRLLNG